MGLKAIETKYAGCRFRSRLEARWAVALDTMGVEWRYEPQGFETSAGPYLPDFHLPKLRRWVEIKGPPPSDYDLARGAAFAESVWESGERYRILAGDIPREYGRGIPALTYAAAPGGGRGLVDSLWTPARNRDGIVDRALAAARSARFEHGETPIAPSR